MVWLDHHDLNLLAVHTLHIGGVFHSYRGESRRLVRQRVFADVSAHAIGAREADLAVWLRGRLLPSQDGRKLRILNRTRDWADEGTLPLPVRVLQTAALDDGSAWAGLQADGQVLLVKPRP